ncbi:MAG: 4Fe-4S dicluster domain-containing protein [Calditrichaeota bacterium]|nr:MAG: 4Fe-4S dicluster domain-containing protein [Calditrichota bacterium]
MSPVVSTIDTRCKRCFSCIRLCPAKAIKFENGQAKVIVERCIACGNCIQVCPQHAKRVRDGIARSNELLRDHHPVFAILAPSFAAAFASVTPEQVIAGIKLLGFDQVWEAAFGADLIMEEYARIHQTGVLPTMITSPCPAIVNYIEKYHPHLTMVLAPIVSPMIAVGRAIKWKFCPSAAVVFIGPCVAKKKEMEDEQVLGVIDEVLTFNELQTMFQENQIELNLLDPADFDGPRADRGRVFPLSGGLFECSDADHDILNREVLVSEGRDRVLEVLQKVDKGDIEARFLDLLFCRGCIHGPMMANDESVYVRRDRLVNYIYSKQDAKRQEQAKNDRAEYADLNLKRGFSILDLRSTQPNEEDIREILQRTGKWQPEDELNCGACGYPSCREKAIAVYQGLAEAEMCLPYMLDKTEKIQNKLAASNRKIKKSLLSLKMAQEQLIQSEKMASVGKLAAGVAHELNNPLGGILLFTNILLKKLEHSNDADALKKIANEAERCRHIVQGLLDFSRQSRFDCKPNDIHKLIDSTLKIVIEQPLFQSLALKKEFAAGLGPVFVDHLQIQQVLLNLFMNAAEAMQGRGELLVKTGSAKNNHFVLVSVCDSGPGMSKMTMNHIFDPFFTTKPVGRGTGLGLAIVYGIMRQHGGDIRVESQLGKGSQFTMFIPTAN